MLFNADFHVHSRYSRATSRDSDLEHLALWAQRKGLTVVGTGDFTHPGWLAEVQEKLEPAENGLYSLKSEYRHSLKTEFLPSLTLNPDADPAAVLIDEVRFILTVEISSIYKRHDRVRKVHNLIFVPNLDVAARLSGRLDSIGNVRSDGRPILGLDSRDLFEIVLDCSEDAFLVPAHIWTPHFSVLGARSGFDSIEECFGDLADRIFAVETGLSSDPPMNWRLSALDGLTLISNSDAHSPSKLAREANVFDTELSFPAIRRAIENPACGGFLGTIEFFPEEGKYHLDGHRACNLRMTPEETVAANGLCPVCGRKVTLGVAHRVGALADRKAGLRPRGRSGFVSLIPLPEILGEILRVGPSSKKVLREYTRLLRSLGPEIHVLRDIPLETLGSVGGPLLEKAIRRMRAGDVHASAGYDGKFGTISLLGPKEREGAAARGQKTLF